MRPSTSPRRRGVPAALATVLWAGLLAPLPATAVSLGTSAAASAGTAATVRAVEREGRCRSGAGEWDLEVRRTPRGRLRIDFRVDEVGRHQRWQVFVANGGHRVAAVTRFSGLVGEFRVRKLTRNRRGVDRIAASAVNPRTHTTCSGHLRF